jgi:DNA-binding NarL/FixJ family response regulator
VAACRPVAWFVEIMLSAGELDEARTAARELDEIARYFGTEHLDAMAAHARGAVCVAEGNHQAAIEPLKHAFVVWHKAGTPYIAARIRMLLSRAFLALGDQDGAELERSAARKVFERLGAAELGAAELAAPDDATPGSARKGAHGLSPREIEVLRLVASGKTNKAIARELFVSGRTIDRHVSNIFTKIGVPSRAAATAFACKNELV